MSRPDATKRIGRERCHLVIRKTVGLRVLQIFFSVIAEESPVCRKPYKTIAVLHHPVNMDIVFSRGETVLLKEWRLRKQICSAQKNENRKQDSKSSHCMTMVATSTTS